jgi:hypothetical protein
LFVATIRSLVAVDGQEAAPGSYPRRMTETDTPEPTDAPEPTTSTDASASSQSGQGHPLLRENTPEEQELAEGETELTFFVIPPDADE